MQLAERSANQTHKTEAMSANLYALNNAFRNEFQSVVTRALPGRTDIRPFVCDGPPFSCKVFLVGFNPAKSVGASFWSYWPSGYGFDRKKWIEAYQSHHGGLSNSRRRMELIVAALRPFGCLETNIYAVPSPGAAALVASGRIHAPFDYLIETIKPRVIIVHGVPAVTHVERLLGTSSLPKNPPLPIFVRRSVPWGEAWICVSKHLRSVSFANASLIGRKARMLVCALT
jgi:hypothetical protein